MSLPRPCRFSLMLLMMGSACTFNRAAADNTLTCNADGHLLSFDACLAPTLNAYFDLKGTTALACTYVVNGFNSYVDNYSHKYVGDIASIINNHPTYQSYGGPQLESRVWPGNGYPLASKTEDKDTCMAAVAILGRMVSESCTLDATGAIACTPCTAGKYASFIGSSKVSASTYCDEKVDGASTFSTLTGAQTACVANAACVAVADGSCNGAPFTLCKTVRGSSKGACAWQKAHQECIPYCKDQACSNHGKCINGETEYKCNCHDNYSGANCEQEGYFYREINAHIEVKGTCMAFLIFCLLVKYL